MKSLLLTGLLVLVGALGVSAALAGKTEEKPVRVYMIHDTDRDLWYETTILGLVVWSPQERADVWSVKGRAERAQAALLNARKTEIETFVLLPVEK